MNNPQLKPHPADIRYPGRMAFETPEEPRRETRTNEK